MEKGSSVSDFRHRSGAAVVIEVDDETGYAYYLMNGKITGDVWLFNVKTQPAKSEGKRAESDTNADTSEFAVMNPSATEFRVEWVDDANDAKPPIAQVHFREQLHAVLANGLTPGYCRLAQATRPIALPLTDWRWAGF